MSENAASSQLMSLHLIGPIILIPFYHNADVLSLRHNHPNPYDISDSRQQTAPYSKQSIISHVLYHLRQWAQLLPTLGRNRLATPYTSCQVVANNHTQQYNGRLYIPDEIAVSVLYSNMPHRQSALRKWVVWWIW